MVDEDVVATRAPNEAEAHGVVEPLYRSNFTTTENERIYPSPDVLNWLPKEIRSLAIRGDVLLGQYLFHLQVISLQDVRQESHERVELLRGVIRAYCWMCSREVKPVVSVKG